MSLSFSISGNILSFWWVKSFSVNHWSNFASPKQGKEALVGHFRNSNFECSTDDYLPVVLSPPRDGMTAITTPRIVGRRVVSNKSMRKHWRTKRWLIIVLYTRSLSPLSGRWTLYRMSRGWVVVVVVVLGLGIVCISVVVENLERM